MSSPKLRDKAPLSAPLCLAPTHVSPPPVAPTEAEWDLLQKEGSWAWLSSGTPGNTAQGWAAPALLHLCSREKALWTWWPLSPTCAKRSRETYKQGLQTARPRKPCTRWHLLSRNNVWHQASRKIQVTKQIAATSHAGIQNCENTLLLYRHHFRILTGASLRPRAPKSQLCCQRLLNQAHLEIVSKKDFAIFSVSFQQVPLPQTSSHK